MDEYREHQSAQKARDTQFTDALITGMPDSEWVAIAAPARRQFAVVMALLVTFWTAVVVIVLVTFSLRAWDDRGRPPAAVAAIQPPATATVAPLATAAATSDTRPDRVPASAQVVRSDLVLGDVGDFIYFFRDSNCVDRVLTIVMTKATVYAETPCDSDIPAATVRKLVGQPVRVRLVSSRLFLEALFIGSFQFDVQRVWVEAH